MQTNNNKSNQNLNNINDKKINELLLDNKDIFNQLLVENLTRRDKSYICVNELDLIHRFESNLINLIQKLPPKQAKVLFEEINKDNPD